ncbi:AT-hook motif nuclear-localized protein 1 [Canna indica]|uniref:AT-hook motif nuclear-localized protein n=1 Tax=Canna indica TaxID=4628 RepID=A0AAQ3KRK0_9LILI|nr:AT-hook motif nuclear-localized protein 1 [Canna indica]
MELVGGVLSPAPAPAENGESYKAAAGERREEEKRSHGGDVVETAAASAAQERGEAKPSLGGDVAVAAVAVSADGEMTSGVCDAAVAASTAALAVLGERREAKPSQDGGAVVVGLVASAMGEGASTGVMKKKRGRPRKYAPDGSLARPLNPKPLSASVPMGEYTPATAVGTVMKMGRGRPVSMGFGEPSKYGFPSESRGEMVACSAGANFTPHILTVAAGEDVTMKIISFSQLGPQAICILSANGLISNVTLRQPDSFGGTLTYEGRFQLLSLSGSFIPTENGGTRSRSGGMSVSLASADGRVIGGGVAGLLVAASPVQVVVGSFLPSYHMEQKTKKTKPSTPIPMSRKEVEINFGDAQTHCSSTTPKSNLTSSSSFRVENWSSPLQPVPDMRNSVLV